MPCAERTQGCRALRLLFINPGESRHGSTYRARGLCRLLRDLGHEVTYVESNYGDGGQAVSIEQRDSMAGYLSATLKRCALALQREYDILYLQKAWPLTLGCLMIARLRGKRVFIDFDDVDSEWQEGGFRKRLTRWTETWMPAHGDLVTTHNPTLESYIREICRCPVLIIPQGIDTRVFDSGRHSKETEKRRLGLDGRRVLCFLGSFTIGSSRDFGAILEAMREVEDRVENTTLLVIGGKGPLEAVYRRRIRDLDLKHVHITGRVPQEEVPRYLAACDMGLIFMEENRANQMRMSLKLMEYLAMELPVVGHVTGASREVFGGYCHLCGSSAHAMAERITAVLEKAIRKESARDFILRNYDWRAIGRSMAPVLRDWMP